MVNRKTQLRHEWSNDQSQHALNRNITAAYNKLSKRRTHHNRDGHTNDTTDQTNEYAPYILIAPDQTNEYAP
jgi:hypothetical protein